MSASKPIPVLLLALLTACGLAACNSDDDPIVPPIPAPTGTIQIDVTPDGGLFTWTLAAADSTTFTGSGDSVLTDIATGAYQITWTESEGFYPPHPPGETLSLAAGDTITFNVTYFAHPAEPVDVLFLGSSYFGCNALIDIFANLAAAKGQLVEIGGHYPSGRYLNYHVHATTTDALIRSRQWDYVILQGVGRITAYPASAHFDLSGAIRQIAQKVHQHCPEARVMFQMPWAFEDGMLWTPEGTDDYFAMQQHIYDQTLALAADLDICIAPVGWAWNTVMLESPPLHYLFMSDWNHPSLRGSYLMACVFYSAIFCEAVTGATWCGAVPAVEALHFQEVASDIVLDDLELWQLEGTEP